MIQLDESRLRRALSDILDTAPDVPSAPLDVTIVPHRRWHLDLVAAAVVLGIGVAGIAVLSNRDRPASNGSSSTTTVPVTTAERTFTIPADGRLVFDPVPEGLQRTFAARNSSESTAEAQVYVENRTKPELGAAIFVRAYPGDEQPQRDTAEQVTVQSAPGVAFTEMAGEHVAFGPVNGVTFYLDGYGMTRDDLLAVAEGATLGDHDTAAIDPEYLPSGMTMLTAGSYNESDTFTPASLGIETVGATWFGDGQSRVLGYVAMAEFGHLFTVNRLAHHSVEDIEIGGLDGYVRVDDLPEGRHTVVTLTDGERTLFVFGGWGYTEGEVVAFAATLRPATDAEWSAMLLETDERDSELNAPPTVTAG